MPSIPASSSVGNKKARPAGGRALHGLYGVGYSWNRTMADAPRLFVAGT